MERAQVEHVAKLARLHLPEETLQRLPDEMTAILAYVDQLRQIDTDGIEQLAQPGDPAGITRADVVQKALPVEQVLANAPQANAEAFLVPKAVQR